MASKTFEEEAKELLRNCIKEIENSNYIIVDNKTGEGFIFPDLAETNKAITVLRTIDGEDRFNYFFVNENKYKNIVDFTQSNSFRRMMFI